MDATTPKFPRFSCYKQFKTQLFSFKICCCFLLTFVVVPGLTFLVLFLVLKPQRPLFSIQTVKLESYKLDVESQAQLYVSSVLSFNLSAANPNKVGIRYGTSRLRVLNDGITIGMIRVPRFYQPPKSKDISVPAQVIFECMNVSKIVSGKFLKDNTTSSVSNMRILGDVKAQLRLSHLTLPQFRVAMDCDVTIDHRSITSLNAIKNKMISLPTNFNSLFNKCSTALYL